MNILVTDGESRSALAVVRSLGRRGCKVVVTGKDALSMTFYSRFCYKGYIAPDPLKNRNAYCEAIFEIVRKESIDIIFAITEQSIYQLNSLQSKLPENVKVASPSAEKMLEIGDKYTLCRRAEKLGIPIPQTIYMDNYKKYRKIIGKIRNYPVVVKPSFSKIRQGDGFLLGKVRYAFSREELEQLYSNDSALKYPSLIQERIIGSGTGLFTLYDGDQHIALFSHRRIREKPPSGGVSVVCESVPLDDEMINSAGRLLSEIGWRGVAMVEYKRDQRDGKAKLIEINGRFWGSLQLAVNCGIDFPSLYLDYLQGIYPKTAIRDYPVGNKLKWFFGTLDNLVILLSNSKENINLSYDGSTKWNAIIEFLKIREKNASFDVFDRSDFKPFLIESLNYIFSTLSIKIAL